MRSHFHDAIDRIPVEKAEEGVDASVRRPAMDSVAILRTTEPVARKRLIKLIENGENYLQYKPIHAELKKLKNGWTNKRDKYEETHQIGRAHV